MRRISIAIALLAVAALAACGSLDAKVTNGPQGDAEAHARTYWPWRIGPDARRTSTSGPCGASDECQGGACPTK